MAEEIVETDDIANRRINTEVDNYARIDTSDEDVARLMDEVMTPEALAKFPSLDGLSDRDMLIMLAVAHNFSYRPIADALSISVGTVSNVVKRIDPCGLYRLDPDSHKAFIAQRARSRCSEVLSMIDPSKVQECTPVQQVKMAKGLAETAAIQEKRDVSSLGGKGIKKVTVEFVDEIDESKPIAEVVEERPY